jgi:uncharacterized protein YcbX
MDGRCRQHLFADGYPLLVTTTAAGTELAERVQSAGGPHVDLLRFRANLVLDGLEAHEEDHLAQLHIRTASGVVTLRPVKPCTRCPIPDIDPATAASSLDVSTALAAYRADARMDGAITFGMNAMPSCWGRPGAGSRPAHGGRAGVRLGRALHAAVRPISGQRWCR